jgi:hypothetical protein
MKDIKKTNIAELEISLRGRFFARSLAPSVSRGTGEVYKLYEELELVAEVKKRRLQ